MGGVVGHARLQPEPRRDTSRVRPEHGRIDVGQLAPQTAGFLVNRQRPGTKILTSKNTS